MPIQLTPAAKSALLRASTLGQRRLQGLLAVEAAIAQNPDRYPELWALLPQSDDNGPSAA